MCPGWQGTLQIGGGSYLEPTKPQSILTKICSDLSANMFLDQGCKDQIRYVALAGNLADRWGLS